MKNQVLKLELTFGEIEVIFNLLQEGPFRVVQPILNKIQSQTQPQIPAAMQAVKEMELERQRAVEAGEVEEATEVAAEGIEVIDVRPESYYKE